MLFIRLSKTVPMIFKTKIKFWMTWVFFNWSLASSLLFANKLFSSRIVVPDCSLAIAHALGWMFVSLQMHMLKAKPQVMCWGPFGTWPGWAGGQPEPWAGACGRSRSVAVFAWCEVQREDAACRSEGDPHMRNLVPLILDVRPPTLSEINVCCLWAMVCGTCCRRLNSCWPLHQRVLQEEKPSSSPNSTELHDRVILTPVHNMGLFMWGHGHNQPHASW